MTEKRYKRTKDDFETAESAWEDIEERSDLVESFDQYVDREHTGKYWVFVVEVDE